MFRILGRVLIGLICGALLGVIVAMLAVPRLQLDQASDISFLEQEQAHDRLKLLIVGTIAAAGAVVAGVAGRFNLGERVKYTARGAMAGAFLAVVLTLVAAQLLGQNLGGKNAGRVHDVGRNFILPFLTLIGGAFGWLRYRMRQQPVRRME